MALATLVANQMKLKRYLGLVLQVLCLISDCCTQIELYADDTQAEQSVPFAFAHQFQFLGLCVIGHTCYRYHSWGLQMKD